MRGADPKRPGRGGFAGHAKGHMSFSRSRLPITGSLAGEAAEHIEQPFAPDVHRIGRLQ